VKQFVAATTDLAAMTQHGKP